MYGFGWVGNLVQAIKNLNTANSNIVNLTDKADKTYTFASKLTGVSCGAAGLGKGLSDTVEAFVCQDEVCAVVGLAGICFDTLSLVTSFVPGPNVTALITVPGSIGCKTFVYCCKKSKLPWGC